MMCLRSMSQLDLYNRSCDSPVSFCSTQTVAGASMEINAPPPAISPTRLRFSRIHGQSCDDSLNPGTPLLRRNPVNPRRSRRYATDFGLGRRPSAFTRVGTPFEDGSSLASSRSSSSTAASDSDDLASLYDCAAADFPEPPPIGSPVIRRMQSFGAQILDINSRTLSRGYTPGMPPPVGSFGPPILISPALETSRQAAHPKDSPAFRSGSVNGSTHSRVALGLGQEPSSRELVGEGLLDLDVHPLSPSIDIPSEAHVMTDGSDLLQWSIARRSHPFSEEGCPQPKPTFPRIYESRVVPGFLDNKRQSDNTQGRLPRIIRKVASMRSDTQRLDLAAQGTSGQRPVPKSRSFRSILHSSELNHTFKSAHDSDKMTFLLRGSRDISTKSPHPPASLPPDAALRSKKDQERVRRHHFSVPFTRPAPPVGPAMSMDPSFLESSSSPVGLHCSHCTHNSRKKCSCKLTLSRSFIDITPEDDDRHESKEGRGREKVRDFISKAAGMFRWGKQPKPKN